MSDDDSKQPTGKPKGRPPLQLVPADAGPRLRDNHIEDLRKSGLTDETIELARLYTEARSAEVARILGRRRYDFAKQGPALVFPFVRPGDERPYTARIKPTTPRVQPGKDGKRRLVKYDQCAADGLLVYWAPRALRASAYSDAKSPLYFTEGEKKTLVLDQLGYTTVGLTGVWNWLDPTADEARDGRQLHPEIREHCSLAGRECVIVFDADATENDQVMLAARQLAGRLQADGAALVRFACPPDASAKQGIDDYFVTAGEAATRALLEQAAEIERPIDPKSPLARVCDFKALRGAPKDALGLLVPAGYNIRKDGTLWAVNPDPEKADKLIAAGVLLVLGYRVDHVTGEHKVEVAFQRRAHWRRVWVDAKATVDKPSMIAALAPHMAPVTGNTASALIDWIAAFRAANDDELRDTLSVKRLGWVTVRACDAFVLDRVLGADGPVAGVVVDDSGSDLKKVLAALQPRGSFDAHIEALRTAWNASPACATAIAASLAAPLLERLGAPNFAVHLAGDSSRGKTSMLVVAASVWGDPDPDGHLIRSWNTNPVAAEIHAHMMNGLPLCYDEVGVTDPGHLERMVYMLINGVGKGRGQRDITLRELMTWHSPVISTGEHTLAGDTAMTGAQVRVLQPHVSDFGQLGAEEIDALRRAAADNCGQAGRRWLAHLLQIGDWSKARAWYADTVREFRTLAGGDPLAGRRAGFYALLGCVEAVAAVELGLGHEDMRTMAAAFQTEVREQATPKSLAERARDLVEDWVSSEPQSFPIVGEDCPPGDDRAPVGNRVVHGYQRGETLLLINAQLRQRLESVRMPVRETLHAWQERGWLERDPDGRHFTRKHRVNGKSANFITLCWAEGGCDA